MEWDYGGTEEFEASGAGLFVVNEGNFQYGNATLSYYDPETRQVENEVFRRANGFRLGDTAQSMTVRNGTAWVVVNNSHVIFAIDTETFVEKGRIVGFTSPRYIHFLSDRKAYVTQLWDNRIFIVDPERYEITGHIECPGMTMENGSTERMVQYGRYLYVNCWSYQNRILKIDTETDAVVGQLEVGIQPAAMVLDRYGKLWVYTDGGYGGSPYGHEAPALCRIDAETFTLEKRFGFRRSDRPGDLAIKRPGRPALLARRRGLVHGDDGRTAAPAPHPAGQRHALLQPHGRPRAGRSLCGRRHRLPTAGHRLPLLGRRRTARPVPGGNHTRIFLLEIKEPQP